MRSSDLKKKTPMKLTSKERAKGGKTITKAQSGKAIDKTSTKKPAIRKQEIAQKPNYRNLGVAVDVDERALPSRGSNTPTKKDSIDYERGFQKGLKGKQDLFENTANRMGRYEGEKTPKKFTLKKKSGGKMKKCKGGC